MPAADQGQVVHELIGLALVDAFAAGTVAEPIESLNGDRGKSNLELVRRAAVGSSHQHASNPEILFDRELFYALQTRQRLQEMIERYDAAFA